MYLLTYSRADLEKVPTRDVFAEMVSLAWMKMAGVKVKQWVVARELHADAGASESHSHYHMALKLEKHALAEGMQVLGRRLRHQGQF